MEAIDPILRDQQLEESKRRLPGPPYYKVLRWIHQALEPANYVEIGIRKGFSLLMALPGTPRIGIDPEPMLGEELPDTRVYEETSDAFFARRDLGELLQGPFALAFIDGLHLFEQVLRDFINLERYAAQDSVILLHDCLPFDERTSSRERTTDFYSGDVWKAAMALMRVRPDLRMATVRTAPTGLTMVRGLDPGSRVLEQALAGLEAEYRDLGFDHYASHRDEMPPELPPEEERVRAWLGTSPG